MNLISILLNHLQCQTMWPAVFWAGPLAVPTQWSMLWISISTEADGHAEKMLNTMFNWNWVPDFQNFCPLRRCRGTADLTSISTRAEKRRWWCAQAAHMPLAVLIALPLTSFPSWTVRVMHWGFIICSSPWHCEGGSRGHPRRELEIDNLASRTFRGFHDRWKPSSSYWVLDSSGSSGWDMYTYILSLAVKLMRTNRWNQNSNTFRQLAANNFVGPEPKDLLFKLFDICCCQELRFHGVEMDGPSKGLSSAGKSGAWKHNLARDMLRKVGKVAPCPKYKTSRCFKILITWNSFDVWPMITLRNLPRVIRFLLLWWMYLYFRGLGSGPWSC